MPSLARKRRCNRWCDLNFWNLVKARQQRRQQEVGDAIRRKLKRSTGRAARHLFSSILKCKICGSNYVLADKWFYACSGHVNGKVCTNDQRLRRDVMQDKLLAAIRNEPLSGATIERFKVKLLRRLRRPAGDAARVKKLESEVANIVETLAQGIRSAALLERLRATEGELERLRAAAKVVDVKAIMAAIPGAIARYRQMVSDLGNSSIDIEQGREIIRSVADRIPVRPGLHGVPIAELSLNEEMPLGQLVGGNLQIDMVAGACLDTCLLVLPRARRPLEHAGEVGRVRGLDLAVHGG